MSRPVVHAAGGVLWRGDPQRPEVALVHRPRYDDWSLPKGKAKPGEHLIVTACREVREETGSDVVMGPYLTVVRYRVRTDGRTADKVVPYWSMRSSDEHFEPNREVDDVAWMSVSAAKQRVDKPTDRVVLDAFRRSPRDTTPLVLVRNAATAVNNRRGLSRGRPPRLNRSGREQAAALVSVLGEVGATRLLSADVPACVDTLRPFASATGTSLTRIKELTRPGFTGRERSVTSQVRGLAKQETLAVCGPHRVITELLELLSHEAPAHPPHERSLRKGGWWILHHRQGAVLAYERHEPAA